MIKFKNYLVFLEDLKKSFRKASLRIHTSKKFSSSKRVTIPIYVLSLTISNPCNKPLSLHPIPMVKSLSFTKIKTRKQHSLKMVILFSMLIVCLISYLYQSDEVGTLLDKIGVLENPGDEIVVTGADCNNAAFLWAPPIRVRFLFSEISSISCWESLCSIARCSSHLLLESILNSQFARWHWYLRIPNEM